MSQDTASAWAWSLETGWIEAEKATIPATSPCFLYGESLFESVRGHKGSGWLSGALPEARRLSGLAR